MEELMVNMVFSEARMTGSDKNGKINCAEQNIQILVTNPENTLQVTVIFPYINHLKENSSREGVQTFLIC